MADVKELIIRFDGCNVAEANLLAQDMSASLSEACPGVDARAQREDATTQDFGSIVAIVLGAKAVEELSKGLVNWLSRKPESKITIARKDGSVIVENLTSKDAANIADKL